MNRELEQFFTNADISHLIAAQLSASRPTTVIDVGVGEGALLSAIKNRWSKVRLLGVDIDPSLKRKNKNREIEHILKNGLDHKLPEFLHKLYGNIDLAVSNPPYKAIQGTKDTKIILEDAGLLQAIGSSKSYPAELVFLAQNLRILKNGGSLAIIVPSGIINSDRWIKLRSILCMNHTMESVIELPDKSFAKTEAKTYVLILKKGGCTKSVKLYQVDPNGKTSLPKTVTASDASKRMDWSYYEWLKVTNKSKKISTFLLSELRAEIFRGQLSASEAKRLGVEIFHTSDMDDTPCVFQLNHFKEALKEKHVAQAGDILIGRVGSRCLGRRAYIKSGKCIVSDSVYVIRVEKPLRKFVWDYISSAEGLLNLEKMARGVCAKYITKKQLLNLSIF